MLAGVYSAKKKDGTVYFRSSLTYNNKHISLGSFSKEIDAHSAYMEAKYLTKHPNITIDSYNSKSTLLNFEKWVIVINFRDNGLYIKNPIYLKSNHFLYYLSINEIYLFDIEDLFYYSNHKIINRKGYLYVNDYGMQININLRYGIKNHAVLNKDYFFSNGNPMDYRYENIINVNPYQGVKKVTRKNQIFFQAKIHLSGEFILGYFKTEIEAAIAYNKAVDIAYKYNCSKHFETNYILELSGKEYADLYMSISLLNNFINYLKKENSSY